VFSIGLFSFAFDMSRIGWPSQRGGVAAAVFANAESDEAITGADGHEAIACYDAAVDIRTHLPTVGACLSSHALALPDSARLCAAFIAYSAFSSRMRSALSFQGTPRKRNHLGGSMVR
jgi:hypothetical protein